MAAIVDSSVWAPLETLEKLPVETRTRLEQGWAQVVRFPARPADVLIDRCLDLQIRLGALETQQRKEGDYLRILLGFSFLTLVGGIILLGWAQARQRETTRRLREIYRTSLVAVEAERKAMSRELHDTVAQDLAAVKIRLTQLDTTDRPLGTLLGDLDSALGHVRRMAVGLRPPSLDRIGFSASIRELCLTMAGRSSMKVRFDIPPSTDGPVDEEVGLHLYRIAQEALQNAFRHSGGKTVSVVLRRTPHKLVLEVEDDGQGPSGTRTGPGLGVMGMGERAALLGARWTIESVPGSGTKIYVEVPLDPTDCR
jgi:signal transduction histidine kinase